MDYQVSWIGVQTGNTCWSDFNWKRKILWKCGRSEGGIEMRRASAQCGRVGQSGLGQCRRLNTTYAISGNQMKFWQSMCTCITKQGSLKWRNTKLFFKGILTFSAHKKMFFIVTKPLHQTYEEWSCQASIQVTKTLRSTSIRYQSDTFPPDRYLIHIDPRAFAIRAVLPLQM